MQLITRVLAIGAQDLNEAVATVLMAVALSLQDAMAQFALHRHARERPDADRSDQRACSGAGGGARIRSHALASGGRSSDSR